MDKYRLTVTVYSDKEHPPIRVRVMVPDDLALILMATPVKSVRLAIEQKPGFGTVSELVDFR